MYSIFTFISQRLIPFISEVIVEFFPGFIHAVVTGFHDIIGSIANELPAIVGILSQVIQDNMPIIMDTILVMYEAIATNLPSIFDAILSSDSFQESLPAIQENIGKILLSIFDFLTELSLKRLYQISLKVLQL